MYNGKKIIQRIRKFTKDRNWEQLHIGENLAKSLVLELADYLNCINGKKRLKLLRG